MPVKLNPQTNAGLPISIAVIVFLALCVAAAFLPILDAAWVYDDLNLLRPSPALKDLNGLIRSISTDLYTQSGSRLEASSYWRPLTMVSYWLDTRFGEAPGALHLGNLILQSLAAALLAVVIIQRYKSTIAGLITAFIAAAWWALHPMNVEVAAWISCRYDILTGIALLCLLVIPWRKGPLRAALFGLVFLAGLFSKEGFTAMAVIIFAMDFSEQRSVKEAFPRWIAIAIAFVIWTSLRAVIGIKGLDLPPVGSILVIIRNYFEAIFIYFWRAFTFPPLSISHPFTPENTWNLIAGVIIFSGLVAAALLWRPVEKNSAHKTQLNTSGTNPASSTKISRPLVVPVTIFLAGLVPMAGAMTMFSQAPERYFYIPSIGLALLIAALIQFAFSKANWIFLIALPSAFSILLIMGVIRLEQRLPDWKNDISLWSAALRVDPQDPQANYNLAIYDGQKGKSGQARTKLKIAAKGDPDSAAIACAYAWILLETNDDFGALREAKRATLLAPFQPNAWYYLAFALHKTGDIQGELEAWDELLKIAPDYPRAKETRDLLAREVKRRTD